jgi:cytochrome o ubiquinol oxidase subunit 2
MTSAPAFSRRVARICLPALALILCGCSNAVFDPAGDIAREQRDIILISTALMLLIIIPVMVLIVLFAWRYRKGKGGTYDPTFDHSTPLELAIWSAPLLIIIALGALTWSSTHLLDPFRPLSKNAAANSKPSSANAEPLVVEVVSLDWKWLFIYPEQGIATVNELALPVDRTVRFDLTSSNMMNAFYSPTLAGMIYTMPGMQSRLYAVLRRTGDFDGFSGNYSGAGFSDMHFRLKGVDESGFAQWLAEAKASKQALTLPNYLALTKPSERVPVIRYASVDHDLYRRILERCVDAGSTCMSDTMAHDHMQGHVVPPTNTSVQPEKPEGALFKAGDAKETGEHTSDHDAGKPVPDDKTHGHD